MTDEASAAGAYYTGEDVAAFVARRALWEALVRKLEADLEDGRAPEELDPEDLRLREAPSRDGDGDARRAADVDDPPYGFDAFYDRYEDDPAVLEHVNATLGELTVCDPAAGGGSLLLAVAGTLYEWRSRCVEQDGVALRREIVSRNLFGVDLRERATEACRRRLREWLLEAVPADAGTAATIDDLGDPATSVGERADAEASVGERGDTESSVATREHSVAASGLDSSVRTGNSLLGFVEADPVLETRAELDSVSPSDSGTRRSEARGRDDELRERLDERYAGAQRDAEDPPKMTDRAADAGAAWRSLNRSGGPDSSRTLRVTVPDGLPDPLIGYLEDRGFATYTYTARLADPTLEKKDVEDLFDRLRDCQAASDWEVVVEREYVGPDFAPDRLDACHWPLAFPAVFRAGGFDVVVANPPYGAAIDPAAEPLLTSEANYECQGTGDSCEWFYERALELAHGDGVVSVVVNKAVTFYSSWSDIREKLLAETAIRHVFDVGLGFADVNLETVVLVHALGEAGEGNTAAVYRSEDRRKPGANRPLHIGWVDQRVMRDAGTIVFSPVTAAQRDVLDRILARERRLGEVMSAEDTTRQLYIPDSEKERLEPGDDAYINRNPWVQPFHLTDVWHRDLSAYRESVEEYAVPRVMLKVLRGSRLRAWLDIEGELVGTEKLVNVPLEGHSPAGIAFVYAALNHPCASYYLQTAVFSGTTETARVMDGQYSKPIPIPDPPPAVEDAVAVLAWVLTLARQLEHDSHRNLEPGSHHLRAALDALVGGLYLDIHGDRVRAWSEALLADGPPVDRVREVFGAFYTARFADRDGSPEEYYDAIESLVDGTVAVVADWDTDLVCGSREMAVVEAAL